MNGMLIFWVGVGLLAGIGHAAALWRSADDVCSQRHGGVVRLVFVAAVLIVAALAQRLLPVATGWGCGLAVTGLLLYVRTPA